MTIPCFLYRSTKALFRNLNVGTSNRSQKYRRPCVLLLVFLCVVSVSFYGGNVVGSNKKRACAELTEKGTYSSETRSLQIRSPEDDYRQKAIIQRGKSLARMCKRLQPAGITGRQSFDHLQYIIVNDEYKLLYCPITKIACTNLKRVFLILTGKVKETEPLDIPSDKVHFSYQKKYFNFLSDYSKNEVLHRLRTYKKIIFVREPFERLLSAYRDKFIPKGDRYFNRTLSKAIIKKYRNSGSPKGVYNVTFSEFVQYVIDDQAAGNVLNIHWRTYTDICQPCDVHYDFIGDFGNLDQDMSILLQEIGVSSFIRLPKREESYRSTETQAVFSGYYEGLPKDDLTKLKALYANDSMLFDYPIPSLIKSKMKKA